MSKDVDRAVTVNGKLPSSSIDAISTLPRATLRLQLNKDFTFADARARIPYFSKLGISHLYLSPILTARAGSTHGYDVVDYGAVNPELGGEAELRALVAALRTQKMGLIVDIVPNHMAVGGNDNKLWLDVLQWGPASRYADFFDIDWDVPDIALRNRLLAPFLGKSYGETLRAGEIKLDFDAENGNFAFHYFEHQFPLAPHTYASLLRLGDRALAEHAQRFQGIHKRLTNTQTFAQHCTLLAESYRHDASVMSALKALLQRFNACDSNGITLSHNLLEHQHYRLASWRTAADEINWRRFFDIIQLAGVRVQSPMVFDLVHATTLRLYAEGLIDGVRVDHIDGLAYPRDYCHRLHIALKRVATQRPTEAAQGPAYLIVEKILSPEERLPRDWRVDGTTGYSFMNEVGALLHDAAGENELAACWSDISGKIDNFSAEMKQARRRVLSDLLPAEFNACAHALHTIARSNINTRDWSLFAVRRVLKEMLVHFPIYRTYADASGRRPADNEVMEKVKEEVLPQSRPSDKPLLDHIDNWLGREAPRYIRSRRQRFERLRAIARFQQLCPPLAAKAVEDTVFYRYSKLLSRNEVGANPMQFAVDPAELHHELARRAQYFPNAMLATATHDHKRGEDLRARLAVISEVPGQWREHVTRWRAMNTQHKIDRQGPQLTDEYMLYQMLVGGWPLSLLPSDTQGLENFRSRLSQWLLKALREAKSITSWTESNTRYESACKFFLQQLLDTSISAEFIHSLLGFVDTIAAAGALNGLTQTLLKFTSPGVPDLYQGCEWWDFSFADPDNRRPVDFGIRASALAADVSLAALQEQWRDGRIKQRVTAQLLSLRSDHPDLFACGEYLALNIIGERARHIFAFARRYQKRYVLVVVPRLTMSLCAPSQPSIAAGLWRDTRIELTKEMARHSWRDCLGSNSTGFRAHHSQLMLSDILYELPFAVLLSM